MSKYGRYGTPANMPNDRAMRIERRITMAARVIWTLAKYAGIVFFCDWLWNGMFPCVPLWGERAACNNIPYSTDLPSYARGE